MTSMRVSDASDNKSKLINWIYAYYWEIWFVSEKKKCKMQNNC